MENRDGGGRGEDSLDSIDSSSSGSSCMTRDCYLDRKRGDEKGRIATQILVLP